MNEIKFESINSKKIQLAKLIDEAVVDHRVLDILSKNGKGIEDESDRWDFKETLPLSYDPKKFPASIKSHTDAKFSEIVKDCVSFYNSYGGYLIVGITDKDRKVVGYAENFDSADLNKRIYGATSVSIETFFRTITTVIDGEQISLGLLYIPKRGETAQPAQFRKKAPANPAGKEAYKKDEFYFRERDACRPAKSPEDFEFLYGRGQREEALFQESPTKILDNNLPPRDGDMNHFVGREPEISELWRWLNDPFNPIKVLAGLGGLGKTSIAHSFAERVIYQRPATFTKVLWLGAKQKTFSAVSGKWVQTTRADFESLDDFFMQLALETGCPPNQIPESPSKEDLLTIATENLRAFRYLLFVDDLDTLNDDDQQEAFHDIFHLCSSTGTKAVVTARRNLGTSSSSIIKVAGLPKEDFSKLVIDKSTEQGIKLSFSEDSQEMIDFHRISGGSPLFALSILRLMSLGDSFREAKKHWNGADGEDVRAAAFKREVGRLRMNEAKVFLALAYLRKASPAELQNVTKIIRAEVLEALETLKAFSMTTIDSSLPGGRDFKLPDTLALMTSVIEARVPDYKSIKRDAEKALALKRDQVGFVADAVSRAMSSLGNNELQTAYSIASQALEKLPNNPDLNCLVGRVCGEMDRGFMDRAEEAYEKAHQLGCKRRELYDGWIKVRWQREDWRGTIEICELAEKNIRSVIYVEERNKARMKLGDIQIRLGSYFDAANHYMDAISDLGRAHSRFKFGPERAQIRKLKVTLISRWLGAKRMAANEKRAPWIYISACHTASVEYRVINSDIFEERFKSTQSWIESLSQRTKITKKAWEELNREHGRLTEIVKFLRDLNSRSDYIKDSIQRGPILQRRIEELSFKYDDAE